MKLKRVGIKKGGVDLKRVGIKEEVLIYRE